MIKSISTPKIVFSYLKKRVSVFVKSRQLVLILLVILPFLNSVASDVGKHFTEARLIGETKWNAEYGRIEFAIMQYDTWGSKQDDYLVQATVSMKLGNGTEIDLFRLGEKVAGETYKAENYRPDNYGSKDEIQPKIYIKRLHGEGNMLVNSFGTSSVNSDNRRRNTPETKTPSPVPLAYQNSMYFHFKLQNHVIEDDADNNDKDEYSYAIIYWYPKIDFGSGTSMECTIKIKNVVIQDGTGSQGADLADKNSCQTKFDCTPPSMSISLSEGKLQSDGSFLFTGSASDANKLELCRSSSTSLTNSTIVASSTQISNVQLNVQLKDASSFTSEALCSGSDSYYLRAYWPGKDGRALLSRHTSSTVREAVATFSSPLTIETEDCGNVILRWTMNSISSTSSAYLNTGFYIDMKQGNGNWREVSNSIAYSKDKSEYSYSIPLSEMNKGGVDYAYRVRRKPLEADNALRKKYLQVENSLAVNTNYKKVTSVTVEDDNGMPRITWERNGEGFICDNDYQVRIRILGNSMEVQVPEGDALAGSYRLPEDSRIGIVSCTPQCYEVILQYANYRLDPVCSSEYIHASEGKRKIESVNVDKGYYSNKTGISWTLQRDSTEFTSFELYRKRIDEPDNKYVKLSEFIHTGLLFYNYEDKDVDSGQYYYYKVVGLFDCNGEVQRLEAYPRIGFSQPYASITGRITYSGEQAVEGVEVMVNTSDNLLANRELSFSPNRSNSFVGIPGKLYTPEAFSFQTWLCLNDHPNAVSVQYIASSDNSAWQVYYNEERKQLALSLFDGLQKSDTIYFETSLQADRYYHLTTTLEASGSNDLTVKIYLNGRLETTRTLTGFQHTGGAAGSFIYLGASPERINPLCGRMDDIRFWNRVLTATEIDKNYDTYLSGKENGLVAYYKADEATTLKDGEVVELPQLFDCSAVGNTFNRNHGIKGEGVNRNTVSGTSRHLGIKGISDGNGNYAIINTIPYTTTGSLYNVVPFFGTHKFSPSETNVFVSQESRVFNNVNFSDVSSFEVSGRLTYENTNFPVEGASFEIDGALCVKDGEMVVSKEDGTFTISVPIGEHFIRVKKDGHTFVNGGRYPADAQNIGLKHLFDQNITTLNFYDNTMITVAGRVAGGEVERKKPLGVGSGKSNIGKGTIELQLVDADKYSLNLSDEALLISSGVNYINSTASIAPNTDKIVINTCNETGEFIAQIPAVPLKVVGLRTKNLDRSQLGIDRLEIINVTNTKMNHTDSLQLEDGSVRSCTYHHPLNINYRVEPTLLVTDADAAENVFGDKFALYEDPASGKTDTIPTYQIDKQTSKADYTFGYPIFSQLKDYTFHVEAYESYINSDDAENVRTDKVPMAHTILSFANEFGIQSVYADSKDVDPSLRGTIYELESDQLRLDSIGKGDYHFTVGFPNINDDYLLGLNIEYEHNGKYLGWERNGDFKVYVFGMLTSGNDFVTGGPDQVEFVLRDPPGSNSSAFLEKGSSFSNRWTNRASGSASFGETVMIKVTPGVTSAAGAPGVYVITRLENRYEIDISLEAEYKYGYSGTYTSTTKTTERISTSNSPFSVGAQGDVFIGNSTNLVFGQAREIGLKKQPDKSYQIAKQDVLSVGTVFNTHFVYTTSHIENELIPDLMALRNSFLRTVSKEEYTENYVNNTKQPIYITTLTEDDPRFGTNNFDPIWGDLVRFDEKPGPSYFMVCPKSPDLTFSDTIVYFNEQVSLWRVELARNEEYKVAAIEKGTAQKNYSFDVAPIAVSDTKINAYSSTHSHDFGAFLSGAHIAGFTVNGAGLIFNTKAKVGGSGGFSHGSDSNNSTTVGYTLSDGDASNYFSVDVFYDPAETDDAQGGSNDHKDNDADILYYGGGPIFRTRGGQSSCPYEGQTVTKYYKPGEKVLSEATLKIHVPEIHVDNPFPPTVPAGKEATYVLSLYNNSEAGVDYWYNIRVDDESNPHGAMITMDGAPMLGRRDVFIEADKPLVKTIKLSQTSEDILDYEDIKLILSSTCAGVLGDRQSAAVTITAHFEPSCSDLLLQIDERIVNCETSDTLAIVVKDYDVNYRQFKAVRLQYKSPADLYWTLIKEYVLNEEDLTSNNALIEGNSIRHNFEMKPLSDGEYQIRAISICDQGSGEILCESESITVIKDMVRPTNLGVPAPSNGILTPESEISVTFNESIQSGRIIADNLSVKAVLNGYTVRDNTGLAFDGSGQAYTEMTIATQDDFSIETWFKREMGVETTLFAYGQPGNEIALGFTASNKVLMTAQGKSFESDIILSDAGWQYISMAYYRDLGQLTVYINSDVDGNKAVLDTYNVQAPANGRLYLGTNVDGSTKFIGQMRQVHFWNTCRILADLNDMNSSKTGKEIGLIGYWNLEEGEGSLAVDKSRGRNMLLHTDWFIYPGGHALQLNGTNDYLSVNSSRYPFSKEDNFSVEFWFKGGKQAATLLSLGHGTADKETDGKVAIAVEEDGQLKLRSYGIVYSLGKPAVLDDQWHHLALSVQRGGKLNAYIDGRLTAQYTETVISQFGASHIYFGACHYADETNEYITSDYFKGSMDEIRVWATALASGNIELDKNHKLTGKEKGLVAYYPFEVYEYDEGNVLQIVETLEDQVVGSELVAETHTAAVFADNTPAIKDARPLEDVAFDWTASENKIVFNIKEPVERIENCILEMSIDNVVDAHSNKMGSALKWTAYANMNQLQWKEDRKDLEKKVYEPFTFTVQITNQSGSNEVYLIDDLPVWLQCKASTGVLYPLQNKEIEFIVNATTPIGNYEASVSLTGNNNYKEMLLLNLKVQGEKPDWDVNVNDFEDSMNLIAQLKLEGAYQEDTDDIIAAFIDDECRGLASPHYVPALNSYYVFLDVYGSNDAGKAISFKVWDASTGKTYTHVEPADPYRNLTYAPLTIKGTIANPLLLEAKDYLEQPISLRKGWNWISINVENADLLQQIKGQLGTDATMFKTDNGYLQSPGWIGSITAIDNLKKYRVNTTVDCKLKLKGTQLIPSLHPITLYKGWNWIAYLPSFSLGVNEAMAGVEAQTGDQLRAHSGYAIYLDGIGWMGSLEFLQPGKGYMYNSIDKQKELIYPSQATYYKVNSLRSADEMPMHWSVNHREYTSNMTLTAQVSLNREQLQSENYEIGVFDGENCRGTARLKYEPVLDTYILYLMVYGENEDNLVVRIYDHTRQTEISLKEEWLNFISDGIVGNPVDLYSLELYSADYTSLDAMEDGQIRIYPNPAKEYLLFDARGERIEKIEIITINGKVIMNKEVHKDNKVSLEGLAAGTYFIRFHFKEGDPLSLQFTKL